MASRVEGVVIGSQTTPFPSGYTVVLSYALSPRARATHKTPAATVKPNATFELSLTDAPAEMSGITATLLSPDGQVVVAPSLTPQQIQAATASPRGTVQPIQLSVAGIALGGGSPPGGSTRPQPSSSGPTQPQPTSSGTPASGSPTGTITGRLVDTTGSCGGSCGQLVFFGQ